MQQASRVQLDVVVVVITVLYPSYQRRSGPAGFKACTLTTGLENPSIGPDTRDMNIGYLKLPAQ